MEQPFPSQRASIAFTGTRHDSPEARQAVDEAIDRILRHHGTISPIVIITGGCVGVDAYAAKRAHASGLWVHTVLPADRSRVDPHWREHCTSWEEMPAGTTYRDRDVRMVERTNDSIYVIAQYPENHPESRRSGTWMTKRLAQRKGLIILPRIVSEMRAGVAPNGH